MYFVELVSACILDIAIQGVTLRILVNIIQPMYMDSKGGGGYEYLTHDTTYSVGAIGIGQQVKHQNKTPRTCHATTTY